jgi:hypothetical protein
MTTESVNQVRLEECKGWYEKLVNYREKLNHWKSELYYFAPGKTNQDVKIGIDHFHNQFHIQLINVHDLKHEIRNHIHAEEQINDTVTANAHGNLKEKYDFMVNYLDKLEQEFHAFIKA